MNSFKLFKRTSMKKTIFSLKTITDIKKILITIPQCVEVVNFKT